MANVVKTMIVGLGMDIIETGKIADSIKRKAFLRKVFTESEISECRSIGRAIEGYAGKFALKEAFMKAIGAGIRQGVWFSAIEVLNEHSGNPSIKISGRAAAIMKSLGVTAVHSSLSCSHGMVIGVVVLEGSSSLLPE